MPPVLDGGQADHQPAGVDIVVRPQREPARDQLGRQED
jgi:hypothetical protein